MIDIYQALRKQGCDARGVEWRKVNEAGGCPYPDGSGLEGL